MTGRKHPRPHPSNPNATDVSSTLPSQNTGVESQPSSSPGMPSAQPQHSKYTSDIAPFHTDRRVRKSTGWHGSWPRISKSVASTQVARENIMASDRNTVDPSTNSDSQSTKTLRIISETELETRQDESVSSTKQQEAVNACKDPGDATVNNQVAAPNEGLDKPGMPTPSEDVTHVPPSSSGWWSWLSRSAPTEAESGPASNSTKHLPHATETTQTIQPQDSNEQSPPLPSPSAPEPPQPTKSTGSWFGLWSSSANSTTGTSAEHGTVNADVTVNEAKAKESEPAILQNAPTSSAPTPAVTHPLAGSTWAFWSRDASARRKIESVSSPEQGELAVIGDGSETSPKTSNVMEVNEASNKRKESPIKLSKEELPKAAPTKKPKKGRLQSAGIEPSLGSPSAPDVPPSKSTIASTRGATVPNLLLPPFKSTYHMKENPSVINQITQLILRTRSPPTNHVFLSKETPKIKKAIAIGVHGLFPASYLRPMIGQPTGTSIRFANHCAEAIRRWTESNGSGDCEIEKVALEGEGKIADRVDNLWTLLLNWIEHIKNADLIMLACHSQGVPVSIMLVAKLIDLGVLTESRIGICAMAGVSLGPFPDYNKSGMGMLMGSVAELWQFADPESEISKRYEHALKTVVDSGARITYVGSIDDQLVPLESALYGPASHPYIYRAVFIDGRVHAPDFIAHLVGFALKLRNLGIPDHGLIRELSVPLAGSLYSGGGHSSLYDDGQVYDLAIMHTLETTSVSGTPCKVQTHQGLVNSNPYVLPWIMRGVIEEEIVKTELHSEVEDLLKQFDDWTPTTKALKDVKYRLEAVRSKL